MDLGHLGEQGSVLLVLERSALRATPGTVPVAGPVMGLRRRLIWAGVGVLLLAAFGLFYWWTVRTAHGQWLDIRLFGKAQAYNDHLLGIATVTRAYLPVLLGLGYLAVLVHRLRRPGAARDVVASAGVVAVATLTSRLLRDGVLGRPYLGDHGYLENTFPAGHVTVTASLALGIVWLWVGKRALVSALATLLVLASAAASVIGHAHRPSDVIGSLLLVAGMGCVAVALAGSAPARRRPQG